MNTVARAFVERKEKAIAEDLKTAFSGYERLVRQVNDVRRWTVTIEVAALGLLISNRLAKPESALIPAAVALLAMMVLELRERSSMRFNKKNVLAIESILMVEDQEDYEWRVRNYQFRDLRLQELTRWKKLKHLIASLKDRNVWLWYGFWSLLLLVATYEFT